MPEIHDLVASSGWDEVRRRLRSSATYRQMCSANIDQDGFNPFHYACVNTDVPPDVISKMFVFDKTNLIKCASKERYRSDDGPYPLHLACESGSALTVHTLLNLMEVGTVRRATRQQDKDTTEGRTPLQVAFYRYVDPTYVTYFNVGNHEDTVNDFIKRVNQISSPLELSVEMKTLLDKTNMLLLAGSSNSMTFHGWHPVHVAAGSGGWETGSCPTFVLWFLLKVFPGHVRLKDEDGDLPLHKAAAGSTHPIWDLSLDDYHDEEARTIIESTTKSAVDMLLDCHPSAAKTRNNNGEFPLHLAITSGKKRWSTGLQSIVESAPEVLESRDITTRLYPFMLAASRMIWDIDDLHNIQDIYNLLRRSPMQVAGGIGTDRARQEGGRSEAKKRRIHNTSLGKEGLS